MPKPRVGCFWGVFFKKFTKPKRTFKPKKFGFFVQMNFKNLGKSPKIDPITPLPPPPPPSSKWAGRFSPFETPRTPWWGSKGSVWTPPAR